MDLRTWRWTWWPWKQKRLTSASAYPRSVPGCVCLGSETCTQSHQPRPSLWVSVWPRAQGPGPPSPGLTQARGMLEECQDMTESRSSGGGPLCWETNQNPEPKYTSISLCYFPDEKGQTAKEFVSKVQMPPHFCGSLPRPCYCSVGTPLFFDYRKAPGGFYLMRSDEQHTKTMCCGYFQRVTHLTCCSHGVTKRQTQLSDWTPLPPNREVKNLSLESDKI